MPLLGAIAGLPLLGAIAGCHCWGTGRGAIAGCHGKGAMVRCHGGCHCSVPLLHAGHCWVPCGKVPLLGAIAGWNRLDGGAIAGCHGKVPLLDAMVGACGKMPLLGAACHCCCHCWMQEAGSGYDTL